MINSGNEKGQGTIEGLWCFTHAVAHEKAVEPATERLLLNFKKDSVLVSSMFGQEEPWEYFLFDDSLVVRVDSVYKAVFKKVNRFLMTASTNFDCFRGRFP